MCFTVWPVRGFIPMITVENKCLKAGGRRDLEVMPFVTRLGSKYLGCKPSLVTSFVS